MHSGSSCATAVRRSIAAVLTVWLVCWASGELRPAHASPLWEWAGAPSSGQAFSGRLTASGGEAAYYNPARLADRHRSVDVTTSVLGARLDIRLDDRPGGVDISDAIYEARTEDAQGRRSLPEHRPLPTDELPAERGSDDSSFARPYLTTSMVVPVIEGRWALGFFATISAGQVAEQRPYYVDEREQYFSNSLHFERLGDRLAGSHFAGATGVEVFDGLHFGAGATLAQDATSSNEMYSPDPTDPAGSEMNTAVEVSTRFVPHFGVEVQPSHNWEISSTVHAPYGNRVEGGADIRFWNFPAGPDGEDSVEQQLDYLYDFEPWRLGAGASHRREWGDRQLEVGLHLLYGHWSGYVDRQGEVPVDTWNNTLTPTAALSWRDGVQTIDADLQFAPSPVPEQNGRSNYVDNDRWALSAGWSRPLELFEMPLEIGVRAQFQWLMEQRAEKSRDSTDPVFDEFPQSVSAENGATIEESRGFRTNNPGYPGFRASGLAVGGGMTISSQF